MDPLSDILSLLKPRSYASGGFDAGGKWSIEFPRKQGIRCYAVVSGQCWLAVQGVPETVRLKTGDCFLLPSERSFRLASDMALPPVDAATFFSAARDGGIVTIHGGGDFFFVGSYFSLDGSQADILLGLLPPIVHLSKKNDKAAMRWSVERMRQELREPQPGDFLVVQQLAYMMLVQALRLHLAQGAKGGVGWLFALADKQMSAAINAMHKDPAHRWTLQLMAERAGMSRTIFTLKFKEMVGTSPMEYLTRWRMLLAGGRLRDSGDSVSVIAVSVGYESESAFSTAFKRVMGCAPRQYGRDQRPIPHPHNVEQSAAARQHEPVAR
jgi:AraC-like DNA-binding protein